VQGDGKAAQPVTTPLPAAPANGWCYRGPVPNAAQDVTITIGDCPAPPPGVCPPNRQTVAEVCYDYGLQSSKCARNVDVTKFENVWGRGSPTEQVIPFPGRNVFAIIRNMQKNGILALKFTAPLSPMNSWGIFNHAATMPGPNLSYAISTACGDFSPADSRCHAENIGPGVNAMMWKLPNYTGPALCPLVPGGVYYKNIKMTNPPATHFECTGSTCKVTLQNNHTP
jgi:hypothetical protein